MNYRFIFNFLFQSELSIKSFNIIIKKKSPTCINANILLFLIAALQRLTTFVLGAPSIFF